MDTVNFAVDEVLRGHVEHRSESRSLVEGICTRKRTGKPEIDNCNFLRCFVNQNVLQLDVPMSDFVKVNSFDDVDYDLEYLINT